MKPDLLRISAYGSRAEVRGRHARRAVEVAGVDHHWSIGAQAFIVERDDLPDLVAAAELMRLRVVEVQDGRQ